MSVKGWTELANLVRTLKGKVAGLVKCFPLLGRSYKVKKKTFNQFGALEGAGREALAESRGFMASSFHKEFCWSNLGSAGP
jgi:hypothetical protein